MTVPEFRDLERALAMIDSKDYAAALQLLVPLAEAGDPVAQCNLASLYQCGLGVKADGQKAVKLYERVGELEIREKHLSALAYHNLATIYVTGAPGVQPDQEKARKCEGRARELGFDL